MKALHNLFYCTFVVVAMTTTSITAVNPGQDGFLIDIKDIVAFFAQVGLPATSNAEWRTKMAIEARGIFTAKIYSLALLDGINIDTSSEENFQSWFKIVLPTNAVLCLYGFGGNTLADLVASILLGIMYGVNVDIYISENEYTSSKHPNFAAEIVYEILTLIKNNPSEFTFDGIQKVKILNENALETYKNPVHDDSNLNTAKTEYSIAVSNLDPPPANPTVRQFWRYIDENEKKLDGVMNSILACEQFVNQKVPVGKIEELIVQKVRGKHYEMVTEAFNGASAVLGDFKVSSVPTIRIALAAQKIFSCASGLNILVTNDNPALAYKRLEFGLPWIYVACGLPKEGLQPSINVNMGPLKMQVLYSTAYRKIKHICIMPAQASGFLNNPNNLSKDWALGTKVWQYTAIGEVTPEVPDTVDIDLTFPVKVIHVKAPESGVTTQFNDTINVTNFLTEAKNLVPNFQAYHAIKMVYDIYTFQSTIHGL